MNLLMLAHLNRVERDRKIYTMWTIREIIAHLTGWDDSTIAFIRGLPEEALTCVSTQPWGGDGMLVDMVDIFAPHEEEHAEDLAKIIAETAQ